MRQADRRYPLRPAARRRRGVTLVEMLVTVAMLVIIMTVLVQVFQAATGALSAAQAYQQIDDQLRRINGMITADLEGVTANFTPPLNPLNNKGYFEYGENEFADVQGEDSDDYIRFTAMAKEGRPFTGRMFGPFGTSSDPITITSEYAEIIYFLRNGNLYRRVLLVAPQLQTVVNTSLSNAVNNSGSFPPTYNPSALGGSLYTSWQGVNDLSARPAVRGAPSSSSNVIQTVVLNTLGDLTNRENRFAMPRFSDDFTTVVPGSTPSAGPDGLSDDYNSDNVPDYYPSLYYGLTYSGGSTNQLIFEPGWPTTRAAASFQTLAFPYVYPGAYSFPQVTANDAYGWIHSPSPYANVPTGGQNGTWTEFDSSPLAYLQSMNHNALDVGDNLPTPLIPETNSNTKATTMNQTWWGFPTWRETLAAPVAVGQGWSDPLQQVNDNVTTVFGAAYGQPTGLMPRTRTSSSASFNNDLNMLPPMNGSYRQIPQLFNDNSGSASAQITGNNAANLWSVSWEDDLIMTNVRSFDVKAYDNSIATYVDLGWGDDFRIVQQQGDTNYATYSQAAGAAPVYYPTAPYLAGNFDEVSATYALPAYKVVNGQTWNLITQTFAHEGRMPPLVNDNILDAQYPNPGYVNPSTFNTNIYKNISLTANGVTDNFNNFSSYSSNVGDNTAGIVRLRRVWDSWSTEYSQAPANGVYNNAANPPGSANADPLNNSPWGPKGGTPPIYPSYPAPYQAPLRGIQIQIRVTDPVSQHIKSMTIRQDFTDKL